MQKIIHYRSGPLGAIMDEYERAAGELKELINSIGQEDFTRPVNPRSTEPDFISVQSIANHVVRSGYAYANYIRKHFGDAWTERKEDYEVDTQARACEEIDKMLQYTLDTLESRRDISYDEMAAVQIKVYWGPVYDMEQLLEHAIVHILRHRRQIKRFLLMVPG